MFTPMLSAERIGDVVSPTDTNINSKNIIGHMLMKEIVPYVCMCLCVCVPNTKIHDKLIVKTNQ